MESFVLQEIHSHSEAKEIFLLGLSFLFLRRRISVYNPEVTDSRIVLENTLHLIGISHIEVPCSGHTIFIYLRGEWIGWV